MPNQYDVEDNIEVYTPEVGVSESFDLDENTTSYSSRLNKLKEGGVVDVKLNERAIKWRISHDLYKDYRSGVRELFQNEARACRQARSKYNAKPKIEVRINPDTRDLVIHGIDSLGISEVVFDKVLRVLGVSGNTDGGTEVGQFGMGFASYTTLSDIVKVETWFRENYEDGSDQRYAFIGDNGIDFKILPQPELETFGTRISLTYNAKAEVTGIIDMLTECVKFCAVPTTLVIESDWNNYHKYGHIGVYDLDVYNGIEHCLEKQLEEKLDIVNEAGEINRTKNRVTFLKKVHINNDDYEFVGLIATTKGNMYNNVISGKMNYHLLAGVPIEMAFNAGGRWTSYAINIKNERKFMPTADRDRLTNEAEENIQALYNEHIKEHFTEFVLGSIDDYNKSLAKDFYENYSSFREFIDPEKFTETHQVLDTLNKYLTRENGRSTKLKEMLRENKPLFCLRALNSDYMARIRTKEPDAIFFRYKISDEGRHENSEEYYLATLEILEQAGVIMGEKYIKENKIRPLTKKEKVNGQKIANSEKPIRITNSGYHSHLSNDDGMPFGCSNSYGKAYISTTVGTVNDNIRDGMLIFDLKDKNPEVTKRHWQTIKDMLWESQSSYVLMKPIKGLDTELIPTYSEWLDELKATKKFKFVNEGVKTYKELIKIDMSDHKSIFSIIGDYDSVMKIKEQSNKELGIKWDRHIVVKDNDELFELLAILNHAGMPYSRYGGQELEDLMQDSLNITTNYTFYCNDQHRKKIFARLAPYKLSVPEPLFNLMVLSLSSKPYDDNTIFNYVDSLLETGLETNSKA